jgi:hypothetical protein
VANLWGGYGGNSTPSNCTNSSTPSPFATVPSSNALEDGVLFYPGNELGCYYTGNTVGAAVLTASPAVNTTCTSNGYNVCNGISGPVASIRLEQMRRGYEDYEYLYLLGKKSGRSAAQAIVDTLASDGMSSWGALNWQNVDAYQYITGVEPITDAYSGNCTDTTPGAGGLANGLPYGPVGAESSGLSGPCPGLWASDPEVYENARVQAAEALGYASITAPVISDLSPSSGTNTGGTTVVITGSNFSGATEVQFGGVEAASFTVNSATSITAVTPTGSGAAEVQVFTPNGDNAPSSGSVFTYISPVTVTGVSSNQGPVAGGNTVTISGTDFSSGATVLFGTTAGTNVVVSPATSLTVTAPAGTGEVNVTVTTADGTSAINSADLYTYEAAPAVSSIRPASGSVSGGSTVTITGSGFVSGATAQFGSTAATSVTVASDTSLTATTPASSSTNGGLVNVTVTTPYGTSGTSSTTRYNYLPPTRRRKLGGHHRNGFQRRDGGEVWRERGQFHDQLRHADYGDHTGWRRHGGCGCDHAAL